MEITDDGTPFQLWFSFLEMQNTMIHIANGFLNHEELAFLRGLFDQCEMLEGKESASGYLGPVKRNYELNLGETGDKVRQTVRDAGNRYVGLEYALLPKTVSLPILNIYHTGMSYGKHVDAAFWHDGERICRTDISTTIFLDDPDSYDGGELIIDTDFGSSSLKLPAGDAVFYPTWFVHQVSQITRGSRRACIFWVESLVRDPTKRSILHDLGQVTSWIGKRESIESEPHQALNKVRENLFRMWIEN